MAGSRRNFVKRKGSNNPIRLPVITINTMERATTRMISGARKLAMAATPAAMVTPNRNDTINSFPINLYQSEIFTSPVARALIISVAD